MPRRFPYLGSEAFLTAGCSHTRVAFVWTQETEGTGTHQPGKTSA